MLLKISEQFFDDIEAPLKVRASVTIITIGIIAEQTKLSIPPIDISMLSAESQAMLRVTSMLYTAHIWRNLPGELRLIDLLLALNNLSRFYMEAADARLM